MDPRAARVNLRRVGGPGRKMRGTPQANRKESSLSCKGSLHIWRGRLKWAAKPRRECWHCVQMMAVSGQERCGGTMFIRERKRKAPKAPGELNLVPGSI